MEKRARFQFRLRTLVIVIIAINLLCAAWFSFLRDALHNYFTPYSCVAEGTQIDTPEGKTPVETLALGDKVLSQGSDGQLKVGKVVAIRRAVAKRWLRFLFTDGRELRVTEEHPIAFESGWRKARAFSKGDNVETRAGQLKITSITIERGAVTVYDLTVEPHANFFAGGVLVHNKSRETKSLEALSVYAKTQAIYKQKFKRYGTLVELRDQDYVDKMVADSTTKTGEGYQGFYFKEPVGFYGSPKKKWFQLVAHPQKPSVGKLMYLVNQRGKIWQATYKGKAVTTRVIDPDASPYWVGVGE